MSDSEDIWAVSQPRRVVIAANNDTSSSCSSSSDDEEEDRQEIQKHDQQTAAEEHKKKPSLLPPPDVAFQQVQGRPSFLDPEALRPVATLTAEQDPTQEEQPRNKPSKGRFNGDISKLAPALINPDQQLAGIVTGGAVRYTGDEQPVDRTKKRTAAMPVSEFLDKGPGGAQLPRKRQDRKDREAEKRGRGQSSHTTWKSEAEMVLRQQYD